MCLTDPLDLRITDPDSQTVFHNILFFLLFIDFFVILFHSLVISVVVSVSLSQLIIHLDIRIIKNRFTKSYFKISLPSLSHTLSLSFSLSHTYSLFLSLSHTHTLSICLSLSHTLSLSLSFFFLLLVAISGADLVPAPRESYLAIPLVVHYLISPSHWLSQSHLAISLVAGYLFFDLIGSCA